MIHFVYIRGRKSFGLPLPSVSQAALRAAVGGGITQEIVLVVAAFMRRVDSLHALRVHCKVPLPG